MSFLLSNFVRQTVGLNSGVVDVNSVDLGGPAIFSYANLSDLIATIAGANYFSQVALDLSVNDYIFLTGSDASGVYQVSAVDTSVVPATITLATFGLTGDVGTANIQNGAVTNAKVNAAAAIDFSKLAALTSGNILVGSAGNVPTSVTMSGDATIIASGALTIGANKVTSAKTALNLLQYTTVAITAAQFNGMYAAPKLLVAAGGANTLIVLQQLQLLMTYVSANYANGGVAAVQYDSTVHGAGVIASTTLSAATFFAAASTGFVFNAGVVAETFSTCVNKGLYLSNVTGAFDTGDSTFVAHIWYKIIPSV